MNYECGCDPKLKIHCENVSKTFIQKGNQQVPVIRDVIQGIADGYDRADRSVQFK